MNMLRSLVLITILICAVNAGFSQTTSFTYQGKLTDGVASANGTYQLQFSLYDASSGGTQIGSTLTNNSVSVTGGIFTVQLDFGPAAFDGTDRWLEIAVKKPAEPGFTTLNPRQSVTSAPYAIKSQNASTADFAQNSNQLGGMFAFQYVGQTDFRLTDARAPTAGSPNYIQNGVSQQSASNFNISGNGTVGGTFNANQIVVGTCCSAYRMHILDPLNTGIRVENSSTGGTVASFGKFGTFEIDSVNPSDPSLPGINGGRFYILDNGNAAVGQSTPGSLFSVNRLVINSLGSAFNTHPLCKNGSNEVSSCPSDYVDLSSDQLIGGVKTFTGSISGNGAGLFSLNAGNISSGTLAVARGGTGVTSSGTSGNFLRSDGTQWTSSPLQAGDIPSGSLNYIQNRSAQQALSSFNIDGTGIVGSRFSVGGSLVAGDTVSVTSSAANPTALSGYSANAGTFPAGLRGLYTGTSTTGLGVVGQTNASSGFGVEAFNTNANGTGLLAIGNGQIASSLVAGSGLAAIGFTIGVFAASNSSGANTSALHTTNFGSAVEVNFWNGATQFKIIGAGAVSTIVKDAEKQERIMFAPEAPEVLFEDYGTGSLVEGRAHIELDAVFERNIAINAKHPLRVFIQLEGDCNGVYVTNKTAAGFDVVELAAGRSNVTFSWHVVGNRRDEELSNGPVKADGTPALTRISHYEDLRLPFKAAKPQVQTDVAGMKPTNQ